MSWYQTYYLAKREKATGKVFPAPPFSASGEPLWLLSTPRSTSCDLPEDMDVLPEKDLSEELKAFFSYEDFGKLLCPRLRVVPLTELSRESPFCAAYVPASDVVDGAGPEDEFSDRLTPERFAAFCLSHGRNPQARRHVERYNPQCGAYEVIELEPADYVWHMWVDESSREYQEWLISTEAQNIGDAIWEGRDEFEYVIVMIEG